jgi:hypothetical protein
LIIAAAGAFIFISRRCRTLPEPGPLSAAEKRRLETLLRDPY